MLRHVLNLDAKLDAMSETLGGKLDRVPTLMKQMCASCAAAFFAHARGSEREREIEDSY